MGSVELPDYQSKSLALVNPTPEEQVAVWNMNALAWRGALSHADYLDREIYLTTVPLACEKGVSHWILVDSTLPPNERQILASCESLRKRALVARNGSTKEVITHGVGSVFCDPQYRGRKYASRMMSEMAEKLKEWQTEQYECKFSILYSDIGLKFYAGFGWKPFPSTHIAIPPTSEPPRAGEGARPLFSKDLPELCAWDESSIRKQLTEAKEGKIHVAIIPETDQMRWFHLREEFLCKRIFGVGPGQPYIKGALAGPAGARVWAVWTRSYYGPLVPESGNTLHILRLVVEDEASPTNAESLESILEVARIEAKTWVLNEVELWNPTAVVKQMVQDTGLPHGEVIRDKESIASLMWYGEEKEEVEWVGNEKYGWC
ncbi:lysine acetyltransferase (GNAT family protein) [Phlyctema vagabunda]|uniref:Lysine acetyltransferase (GNAT family protein) n=1 Tax=Phlyctema vagabunda TaxID=108571 RepID=A0ABR4P9M1_9HELO